MHTQRDTNSLAATYITTQSRPEHAAWTPPSLSHTEILQGGCNCLQLCNTPAGARQPLSNRRTSCCAPKAPMCVSITPMTAPAAERCHYIVVTKHCSASGSSSSKRTQTMQHRPSSQLNTIKGSKAHRQQANVATAAVAPAVAFFLAQKTLARGGY